MNNEEEEPKHIDAFYIWTKNEESTYRKIEDPEDYDPYLKVKLISDKFVPDE